MGMGPAPMRTDSRTTSTKADEFRRIEVITGVGRRRRWTDEEKAWIVAESLDPTTTVSAVARRYGLHARQLFVWRRKLPAPAAHETPAAAVPAGARRYGLRASQLFVWRQQLAAPAAHEAPAFVPVVVAESGGTA